MDIYSKTNYKLAYEEDLYPVATHSLWNEAPFRLEQYKQNMKGNQSDDHERGGIMEKWMLKIQIHLLDEEIVTWLDTIGEHVSITIFKNK